MITRFAVIAAAALALAGCGENEPAVKIETKRFIVVSAVDCADNTGLEYDRCAELLQAAVAQHDKAATTYPKFEACEAAEGVDRCERAGEKSYRARVAAFQITVAEKTVAVPLYAPTTDKSGLAHGLQRRDPSDAEAFTFTESAADVSHFYFKEDPNERRKKKKE